VDDASERSLLADPEVLNVAPSQPHTDWETVEAAPETTSDASPGSWYDYPLVGRTTVTVHLARAVGDGIVMARVHGDMDTELAARIETVLDVL
jgi:hypothetical protein